MKAMLLYGVQDMGKNTTPLVMGDIPEPRPEEGEILIKVSRCGVCHTELDEIEGRTMPAKFPIVLGHQVVGRVQALGPGVDGYSPGDRVGVGWIFWSCGKCMLCKQGLENLCPEFKATGRDYNGGYAQYMVAKAGYAFRLPRILSDSEAAPLLCAGAIGYRSLRLANIRDGDLLGLTGFGASGHLVLKMSKVLYPNSDVFVFARSKVEQEFALGLGAAWAGDTMDQPPSRLKAIIDTTPVWRPVVEALKHLEPGGRLVINAIRKEDVDKSQLLQLDYERQLWLEKEIKSVANVTRSDIVEFLDLAQRMDLRPEFQEYDLGEANLALLDLKERRIKGAKVLVVE